MNARGTGGKVPPAQIHGASAVRSGQFLFVSAQAGVHPATGRLVRGYADLDPKGRRLASGFMAPDSWAAQTAAQCWQTFRNVEAVLAAHGATPKDILRINIRTPLKVSPPPGTGMWGGVTGPRSFNNYG